MLVASVWRQLFRCTTGYGIPGYPPFNFDAKADLIYFSPAPANPGAETPFTASQKFE